MTRVLVTGGSGQLAREFALLLGTDAVALGRTELDVADEESVGRAFALHRPELVLHCAAWTDVDGAESDPDGAWRANEYGSRHVARAARACGAALVGFSTDYVFAGDDPAGYDECSPVAPRSVYGASKLAGERAVLAEHPGAHVVRTAWVFSPRGQNFLLTMLRLGVERDEVGVVDDQIGCPTAAAHLARATLELVERCAPGTYHLSGGGSTSWYGFASAIMEEAGLSARVEPIASSELQRPALRPACSILRTVHADAPRLPHWRDGLRDCLAALANAEGT
ncbi:MAG: dTDP-4-dehydrorhamnose reductase [Actinomycetota bacterium]|nr:dTDP-4-dehydrorhamnose reductase [Actinomycetota bacterium]